MKPTIMDPIGFVTSSKNLRSDQHGLRAAEKRSRYSGSLVERVASSRPRNSTACCVASPDGNYAPTAHLDRRAACSHCPPGRTPRPGPHRGRPAVHARRRRSSGQLRVALSHRDRRHSLACVSDHRWRHAPGAPPRCPSSRSSEDSAETGRWMASSPRSGRSSSGLPTTLRCGPTSTRSRSLSRTSSSPLTAAHRVRSLATGSRRARPCDSPRTSRYCRARSPSGGSQLRRSRDARTASRAGAASQARNPCAARGRTRARA